MSYHAGRDRYDADKRILRNEVFFLQPAPVRSCIGGQDSVDVCRPQLTYSTSPCPHCGKVFSVDHDRDLLQFIAPPLSRRRSSKL